jgi:hypothetical protein
MTMEKNGQDNSNTTQCNECGVPITNSDKEGKCTACLEQQNNKKS